MVARILIIASVACVFNLADGLSPPFPGFKPCKLDDYDCVIQNTKSGVPSFGDGIPSLGVKPLDPSHFKQVDASLPNLKFILKDVILTGLKSCFPVEFKRDLPKSQITLAIQCDLKLDGDYEMDGQVLVLKLTGNGKIHVSLDKILNRIVLHYTMKEKDGKKYLRITKFDHKYELKEKSTVVFEGLFADNEVLRKATEEVIAGNGNEIVDEIGGGMFKAAMTKIVGGMNEFFKAIPHDELVLQ